MLDFSQNKLDLKPGAVHIWKANIASLQNLDFNSILSITEMDRAARYRFMQDRRRFIISRGILRILLGRYLSVPSGKIEFNFSKLGKPGLTAHEKLHFNLAHAKDMAIFGFTLFHDLGVDIEFHNPDIEVREIAQRFFSQKEEKELLTLAAKLQIEAFYRCWTRKESFIKALGGGLSIPLDRFSVSLLADIPPAILTLDLKGMEAEEWSIIDCSPDGHYSAAAAVKCTNPKFEVYDFGKEIGC